MAAQSSSTSQFSFGKLLDWFTPDSLRSLLLLYKDVRAFIQKERGLYEILEYDSVLEILNDTGTLAIQRKHQRVKFLQDSVSSFVDYAWGDGENFDTYKCSPGVVADRYKEGDRWNVLISLRHTKNSGEIEDFYIERTVRDALLSDEEWYQIEIRHKTRHVRIAVIFPRERPCRTAKLITRSKHTTLELGPEHFSELPDGRQQVSWETEDIKHLEVYTLKWHW